MRKVTRFLRDIRKSGKQFCNYWNRYRNSRKAARHKVLEGLWGTLGRDLVRAARETGEHRDLPPVLDGTIGVASVPGNLANTPLGDVPDGLQVTDDGWFVREQATDVPAQLPADPVEGEAISPIYCGLDYCRFCPEWAKSSVRKDSSSGAHVLKQGERSIEDDEIGLGDSEPRACLGEIIYLEDNLKLNYAAVTEECGRKVKFSRAVGLLQMSRNAKERGLRMKPRDTVFLDLTDTYELAACDVLFGIFKYGLGLSDGSPERFDKDTMDVSMEELFGSLDSDDRLLSEPKDREEAQIFFSIYLSRKIWSPVPWRKFDTALEGFRTRVTRVIDGPVDSDALTVATAILELIMKFGPKPDSFREVEPNSKSACLEVPRVAGGKREALYGGETRATGFRFVVPKAIYTGGKIRTITISSFASSQYLWINKWLGACFRQLDCSIFGGDVQQWWDKQRGRFEVRDGEIYISGDLENATDNFDSRITNHLIDRIVQYLKMPVSCAEDMKSFTTTCMFKNGRDFFRQSCGNMMGSEISFPILCIFSLTAYIAKNEKLRANFLHLYVRNKRAAFKLLSELRIGVNGDDVVFPAASADFWVEGVRSLGGVVSRGKSLANPYFFTVNSELWCTSGRLWTARPTFLTALNDGRKYFISPTREFLEYASCTLFTDRSVFDIERRLKLNIPVRWGGLGLVKKFDPYTAALAKCTFDEERKVAKTAKWKGSERAMNEFKEIRESLRQHGSKMLVVVSRSMRAAYQKVYSSTAASWSIPTKGPRFRNFSGAARSLVECTSSRLALHREWALLMCAPDEAVMEVPAGLIRALDGKILALDGKDAARLQYLQSRPRRVPFFELYKNKKPAVDCPCDLPISFTNVFVAKAEEKAPAMTFRMYHTGTTRDTVVSFFTNEHHVRPPRA